MGESIAGGDRRPDALAPVDGDVSSTSVGPATGSGMAAMAATVVSLLSQLAAVTWQDHPGTVALDVLDQVEHAQRRLDAVRLGALTSIEADGLWALDGARTATTWLRDRTGATSGAAHRWLRQSRALRDFLPAAGAALTKGEIGADHVHALVRDATRTERLRAQLVDPDLGEEFLVDQARQLDAGRFATLVKSWAIAADPDAADRAWREADAQEELTIAPTLGGYHVAGWLNHKSGQVITKALTAHMGRKSEGDPRTPAQRRADALASLAHQSLDAGKQGSSARVRPHVSVTVSWATLQALARACTSAEAAQAGGVTAPGEPLIPAHIDHAFLIGAEPATFDDGTPLSPGLLARIACESQLSRVVFGADSTILDVGREKRIFPAHQARGIIARDRHCQFPGCDEPPEFGEIHHSLHWAKDLGPTSTDHGVLLCWHHHDVVHLREITISRDAGAWQFTDRHGWPLTARAHGALAATPAAGPAIAASARSEPTDSDPAAAEQCELNQAETGWAETEFGEAGSAEAGSAEAEPAGRVSRSRRPRAPAPKNQLDARSRGCDQRKRILTLTYPIRGRAPAS